MITPDQIEEWVREAEERPSSSVLLIRYIAMRLKDLTARNEELLAENISLRSGRKVEEYEGRIANLEYQVDLLKRQLVGANIDQSVPVSAGETIRALIYSIKGHILQVEYPYGERTGQVEIGRFESTDQFADLLPRLVVTGPAEELLFVFDSGRSETMPVSEIPSVQGGHISWKSSSKIEARAGEELSAVFPIGRMALYEYVIQASRRGCAKKIVRASFEQHLAKKYVGTGARAQPDKTCCFVMSGREEIFTVATREGYMLSLPVELLPYTSEELLRLSATDYIVNGFISGKKPSFVVVTTNGKVIAREINWLSNAESFKSRGQAIFSQARRDAGNRIAGAAAVDEADWCGVLVSNGRIMASPVRDLFSSGTMALEGGEVVSFYAFGLPDKGKETNRW